MNRNKWMIVLGLLVVASMILAACAPKQVEVVKTVVVTEQVKGETVVKVVTPTPAPKEEGPRTLVICMGQEPETLYPYGGSMLAMSSVLEAVFDGPIDGRSFDYQPVILEKLPSLADGDAVFETVDVAPGDTIADADGNVTTLEAGVKFFPSGCTNADCAQEYTEDMGTIQMDKMVVTFKLLPGLKWSDGEPLTAADSVYSFNLAADPDTPSGKYTIERTESYEALDDVTIQWTGLPGYVDGTYFLNFWTPYPEHVWGQYTAAELLEAEESSLRPMGWGPYVIDEWAKGDHISMHKNPNYFRADEGLPKFDNLVYRFVGENSNANIAAILSGECDIVDQTSHLDDQSELLLELQNAGQVNATFVTGTVFEHADFGINPVSYDDGWQEGDRPAFFSDVRVRQAIAMCMDRQAVVDTVMFGQSVVLDTYLPPQHPLFNSNVKHYDFDVEAGSALLEEAGWIDDDGDPSTPRVYQGDNPWIPQGTKLEFNYWTTSATQRQQATQVLQQSLAQCGIKVNLEYWSPGEYFADGPDGPLFGRRFDIGQFAWLTGVEPPCDLWMSEGIPGDPEKTVGDVPWLQEALGPDADPTAPAFAYGWGGWNDPGYSNPEYDKVCKAAINSLKGQPGYEENHLKAQEIFANELPVVPLYLRLKLAATRPDMCGFIMDPTANSEMWNIEEFDYGESCQG